MGYHFLDPDHRLAGADDGTWSGLSSAVPEGETIAPWTPPPLDERKAVKAALARQEGARRMREATASYTDEERATWYQQAEEATAYGNNPSAATPMLDAMAAQRGFTRAAMVQKVNTARAQFAAGVGLILGKQQALEDQIKAAADEAALDAIDPTDPANWPS